MTYGGVLLLGIGALLILVIVGVLLNRHFNRRYGKLSLKEIAGVICFGSGSFTSRILMLTVYPFLLLFRFFVKIKSNPLLLWHLFLVVLGVYFYSAFAWTGGQFVFLSLGFLINLLQISTILIQYFKKEKYNVQ